MGANWHQVNGTTIWNWANLARVAHRHGCGPTATGLPTGNKQRSSSSLEFLEACEIWFEIFQVRAARRYHIDHQLMRVLRRHRGAQIVHTSIAIRRFSQPALGVISVPYRRIDIALVVFSELVMNGLPIKLPNRPSDVVMVLSARETISAY